jgi:hypothetical protein
VNLKDRLRNIDPDCGNFDHGRLRSLVRFNATTLWHLDAESGRGMNSLDKIFARLEKSSFRNRFHLRPQDRAYLDQKGLPLILKHAQDFIDKRLAPAHPKNDGKQTPFRGHPVFVAQHATATCCRSCLSKWHNIPNGRALSGGERAHVLAALERWLRQECKGRGLE